MMSCDLGHSALERFCGMMSMPQQVTQKNYSLLSKKFKHGEKVVAEDSMIHAANEAKEKEGGDIGVSVDGTWQKRWFASLNGAVVTISTSNFKVLDVETMSRYCKVCAAKASLRKENKVEFDAWKAIREPDCSANYAGSAPGMETEGAIRIFKRSVNKYEIRYLKYYGDGDSKTLETVR